MSRFFIGAGDSDSESESVKSEEESAPKAAQRRPQISFSDDEEEEKRIVRSQKDKRFEELKDIIRGVKNGQKIKDVVKVQDGFDALQRVFQKTKTILEKEKNEVPRFYLRALMNLEDFVKELWEDKEAKQKLSKINSKALATLRQRVRKYNKEFDNLIEVYRQNPMDSDEEEEKDVEEEKEEKGGRIEEEEEEEEEQEEEEETNEKETKQKDEDVTQKSKEPMDESDEEDWGHSSESATESEEEAEVGPGGYTREYFLKKPGDEEKTKDEVLKPKRKPATKEDETEPPKAVEGAVEGAVEDGEEGGAEWETVEKKGTRGEMTKLDWKKVLFGKDTEVDHNVVSKKRQEIVALRGKKTTDPFEQLEQLKALQELSADANLGVGINIRLLVDITATIFDIPSIASSIRGDVWDRCLEYMESLVNLLIGHPEVKLCEDMPENLNNASQPYVVHGDALVLIERLDDEFTKILQNTDAHSTDYVHKLQGEAKVTDLIGKVQKYLERDPEAKPDRLCRIYIRKIEHLYYKIDRSQYGKPPGDTIAADPNDPTSVMAVLTKYIYNYQGTDLGRIRTRAMLCHIYHYALHNRWYQARDLMMMSHLQEAIHLADVPTQILYNRALVQLGMCAFRHGMVKDAHDELLDIQSSGRSKELLAQGLIARHDRTPEQEKLERRRQIPFHMHINLELMECVYLTSAMLLEIPYMVAAETEGRKKMISKSFHHQLKHHEKQLLVGPPESMREHVVAATHAMKRGDWRQCRDYILSIKAWDLFIDVEHVKALLTRKIQEETLRTYIFAYGEIYDTLSLQSLSDMFELPLKSVLSIISKMIIKEELLASLDEPTQTIVLHHAKPSKVQSQAILLSEKVGNLAEHNEELMKLKHAGPWNVPGSQQTGTSRQQQSGWSQSNRNFRRSAQVQ